MILRTLREDYTSIMTSVASLAHALDSIRVSLSPESMDFHLVYLFDQGYIQIWRAKDMPRFRTDRTAGWTEASRIMFAKLLPLGVQLIDGDVPADPKVNF